MYGRTFKNRADQIGCKPIGSASIGAGNLRTGRVGALPITTQLIGIEQIKGEGIGTERRWPRPMALQKIGRALGFRVWTNVWGIGLSLVLFIGCDTLQTRQQIDEAKTPPELTEMGPPKPDKALLPPLQIPAAKVPKVGVILGPGGVRAYAHIGVLRSLQKAKIPMDSIVGLEWGAWVAAHYAVEAHPHQAEWSLLKLKEEDVVDKPGLFKAGLTPRSLRKLDGFLNSSFPMSDIGKMKVPFACPVVNPEQNKVAWQHAGDIREALRQCLAYPPIFSGVNPGRYAGAGELAAAAQYLRAQGMDLVIYVDVLGGAGALPSAMKKQDSVLALLYYELAQNLRLARTSVNEVIPVAVTAGDILSFQQRREMIKQGAQSAEQAVQKLSSKYGF